MPEQLGLPRWLGAKEAACNAGDPGLIPGTGRSPGGGHGNPLQYSSLRHLMDIGARQAIVHRVTKSQTHLKQLSMHARLTPCLTPCDINTALCFTTALWQ